MGALIWLIALPRVGTDLSAGLTRAGWAGRYPGAGYLFAWYGGLYPAGYSLLAPYLLAAFGCVLAAGTRPRADSRWRACAKTAAVVMLALLTSIVSPVAELFLGVAAAALVVCSHGRQGLYMGLAAAVSLSVTLAIPGTCRQPIGIQDVLLPLIAVAAVLVGVPG